MGKKGLDTTFLHYGIRKILKCCFSTLKGAKSAPLITCKFRKD